ncbi:1,6-dihydroxycyclohexa-2,4-diene-1-carboxylate dehydrogenase [Methylobacterium frigidaeris]|uniref:Levodione reductase n=2 Tax=Methylobacterium frigidaeris TaxID=2038277 RepID=A0AA37HAE5_9HYPH|nr:1,6-dihydroxycyclohexa-2,4-diene-1-carboxylate dehydrogenase [Methylobacterium frigidaeris]GJD62038.1 Levodione reductase [Methylobacterium frigidaeris]
MSGFVSPGRFSAKVAVVTGAAQGIGREVALRLAREGAALLLTDRSEIVEETAAACRDLGATTAVQLADVETFEGSEGVMAAAVARFGRLDVLVNNVGGSIWFKPFAHYAPHEVEAEIRRSLFPTLWCCRAALPHLLAQGSGSIVNVSSVATRGVNRVPYAAAKGGVNALTACLAFEYAEHGIRVNAVAPGGTEAPPRRIARNPTPPSDQERTWIAEVVAQTTASSLMHRYGTAAEQAAAILFLASDEASYVTGVTLPVAGGDLG